MKQLVCIMFISNNHASFHLLLEQNLIEYQKVSKYYDHDYTLLTPVILFSTAVNAAVVTKSAVPGICLLFH